MRFPGRSAPIDGEWKVRLIYVGVPYFSHVGRRESMEWVMLIEPRPKGWLDNIGGGRSCPLGIKHRAVKPESE